MRTNIEIDDELLEEAMAATGLKTKKATVEEGLRKIVQMSRQRQAFEALRGFGWEGDLEAMRTDREPDQGE
jgi:Arc/MetJ family transcription regulator